MKQRIGYIDALRGFTMFLVVYAHVMSRTGLGLQETAVLSFFRAFRMPMFFFISGFIAYKAIEYFTAHEWARLLKRKAFVQLVPTAIVFSVFQLAFGHSPLEFFQSGPGGYWFTLVLFEFFVVFFTCSLLCNALRRGAKSGPECGAQHRRGGY